MFFLNKVNKIKFRKKLNLSQADNNDMNHIPSIQG